MTSNRPLPAGWCEATIPDVASVNPRNPDVVPGDEAPVSFVPMASVEAMSGRMQADEPRPWKKVKKGYTRFQERDVLFAKITPCMENGKAAVAKGLIGGVGAGSTEFHVLRPSEAIRPELLLHYVLQEEFRKSARAQMTGTAGQLRVPTRFLDEHSMPVPPPPEQHRIVEAIESYFTRLDDAVATLERVQGNLKRYRASVLKAAVEGRLVPTEADLARAEGRDYEPASVLLERILAERRHRWEEAELAKMKAKGKTPKNDKWKAKYKEPARPDTTALSDLPEGWSWATVASISSKVVDGVHKKPVYVDAGVPFVTVKNLTAGPGISFESLRYITQADHESFIARTNPERGDLLVSKDGTLGVVRAIRTDKVFSIFVSVALVKPIHEAMTDYLEIALSSPVMQDQMVPKGSGLQHIHLEDLRADCIPVPPLAEWSRICTEVHRHLSMIEELEREVAQDLIRCGRLRQGVLKWAFEGRLVDQDPDDEPARMLLERIKSEREATSSSLKTKKRRRKKPRSTKA